VNRNAIKIVLINPPSLCVEDDRTEPPLGLLYVAANTRKKGYENISIYDMTGSHTEDDILRNIDNIPEAQVYGINCFCTNYQYAKRITKMIKTALPDSLVILGGPNTTGIPEFTLNDTGADAVISGEGEDSFFECIDIFCSKRTIKGIIQGKKRDDINTYPFPARDLIDMNTYSRKLLGNPVICMISSRGCKYNCIHCNSVVMGGGSKGARYRNIQNIISEIKSLRDHYKYFRFNDDHFTGNPNLIQLLDQIKHLDIQFRAFARIEDLNQKTCSALREAGCIHISIGLESLNPNNLKIIGKASQIGCDNNVKIAKENGLTIRSSFMVGLPFDTDETIEKYFKTTAGVGIDEFAVYPLIPYPGSQIWKNPKKFGYTITDSDFTKYVQVGHDRRSYYALQHHNFGPKHVEKWKTVAEKILEDGGVKHISNSAIAQ